MKARGDEDCDSTARYQLGDEQRAGEAEQAR